MQEYGPNQGLLRRWKMTPEQYDKKLKDQGGVCAICLASNTGVIRGKPRRFAVDHDHDCCNGCKDCIRGLLCTACNIGLGSFQDDAALLRRAANYLDKYRK